MTGKIEDIPQELPTPQHKELIKECAEEFFNEVKEKIANKNDKNKIKIDNSKLVMWSKKIETHYTYGELKITITERYDEDGEQLEPTRATIKKDNYCMPDLVKAVMTKHHGEKNGRV